MAPRHAYVVITDNGAAALFAPYDELFIAEIKARIASACRKWLPHQKSWVVDACCVDTARALVQEHYDEVIVAYTSPPTPEPAPAPPPPPPVSHTLEDCRGVMARAYPHHLVLGLWPGVPLPLVESAYRSLAKLVHPDVRGPAGARKMAEANAAYAALRAELERAS